MFVKGALMVLALAATASLLTATAAAGSARNWTHNGAGLSGNVNIVTHGEFAISSDQGGYSCPITMSVTLEPGSTGKVTAFAPSNTAACTYSGNFDILCGVVDTHASTGLPWTVHATKYANGAYGMAITSVDIDVGGTQLFCPDTTVFGTLIATGNPHDGSILHFESSFLTSFESPATASGTQEITPSGTYKIQT